jgi:predicted CXXCH cytochrome family protein
VRFKTVCFKGVVLALVVLATAASCFGQTVVGTDHDFSGRGWGTTQVCVFCHTPHNALSALVPLWNHATSAATYTLYSSGTLNAVPGQPTGASLACLSCHDGTVAIDSYGTRTGGTNVTGGALLGVVLSNDHPVSFTYDTALATTDGGLVTPSSASLVVANVPLYAGKLECATCHNVHNNALGSFLRVANTNSGLCIKCHIK